MYSHNKGHLVLQDGFFSKLHYWFKLRWQIIYFKLQS